MKKMRTFLAGVALLASPMVFAAIPFSEAFPVDFAYGLPAGWETAGSTAVVNGGLQVTCPQTAPNYRADLKYNMSGTAEEKQERNISINASDYKVFAVQFIGTRPESGVLKLSNIAVEGTGWIKGTEGFSLSEQGWTDIKDLHNNHTYYWTVGGEKWTGDLTITAIEVVIADIKNSSDNSYIVKMMNWYKNVDELEASLDLQQQTAVVNQNTSKGYANISEAWTAAKDGDVLVVNENQTLDKRLNSESRSITVKGANPDITITRTNPGTMLFLANNGGCEITLQDIVLDGDNADSNANFTEASGYAKMNFRNVTVRNARSANALGLVVGKAGCKLGLEGIRFVNCVVNEGAGEAFIGSVGSTISGDNSAVVAIEVNANNYSLTVPEGETLTNVVPVVLTPYGASDFPEGYVLVNGTTDYAKFKIRSANTMYVNPDEENNCLVASTTTSLVENIIDSVAAPVEYFNLQGVKVANPENGLYIRVQGNDVKKVLVR